MKKISFLILFAMLFLGGCFVALPNNKDVSMSPFTVQYFTILGEDTSDFKWYVDTIFQTEETENNLIYFATTKGIHTIRVTFKDGPIYKNHTWYIDVN